MSRFFDQTQAAHRSHRDDLGERSQSAEQMEQLVREFRSDNGVASTNGTFQTQQWSAHPRVGAAGGFAQEIPIPRSIAKLLVGEGGLTNSFVADAYKGLRTRLLRLMARNAIRSIAVGSAVACDGKTLTCANLALCCAQLSSMNVLLVDTDLRTAGLSSIIGNSTGLGLADLLSGSAGFDDVLCATDLPNLHFVSAGCSDAPPPELLAGENWKLFMERAVATHSIVLLDTPPIIALSDFELIAAACDGILLVVRSMYTPREALQKAVEQVDRSKLLGTVLNDSEHNRILGDSYYYFPERKTEKSRNSKT